MKKYNKPLIKKIIIKIEDIVLSSGLTKTEETKDIYNFDETL